LETSQPYLAPFEGPGVWVARDLFAPESWCLHLRDELSFPEMAAEVKKRLFNGPGVVVLRGLPVERFDNEDARRVYLAIGAQLGRVVPQTVRGDLLYSVRDEGIRLDQEYGKPGVRKSKTNAAFEFHTDSPSRLAGHTPEVVGLFVLRTAKSGGESAIVSAKMVHNLMLAERPDLLQRLYRPFWVDRRAELPPGEEPVLPTPVFAYRERLVARYLRLYIEKGQLLKGEPLDAAGIEALDFLDAVMQRPGIAALIPAERGDIQLVSNTTVLHSRAAYVDHAEPELKRHYLRMWLAASPADRAV
jgi:hypothetical protein